MERVLEVLKVWVGFYGMRVLATILILLVGRYLAAAVRGMVRRLLRRGRIEETLVGFGANVAYAVVLIFVVITALAQLGIQTASFVVVMGAAALAIGFALQGSLANFAAGVFMIIFKPFKVGDYIEGGGTAGTVEEISFFTTELKSPDNRQIIVPNAKMTSDNITNFSAREQRRVDITAGVSYGDDIEKVRRVLGELIAADERILADPEPFIGLLELAESSVNFVVRVWVRTPDYWNVFFSFQEQMKKRFDAEGITIPFPQRDVHLSGSGEAGKEKVA